MLVFRPVRQSDLPGVEALARESPVGVTTLPASRDTLYRRIQASIDSLAADVSFHGEESYLFVLEDSANGELVGVSGIVASAGFTEPFYNYRNETLVHASPGLGIYHKVHALALCHDLTGNTLLSSYYIREPHRFTAQSDLLSRGRFLFMANWPRRAADAVVSEMVGVTRPDGSSPFWDSVGAYFFGMEYREAELHCGVHGRKFIAELMPHHPIYVPLLSDEAQASIGQVGADAEVPYDVLVREGFEAENYVDIFDGGPTLYARTERIRTVAQSRLARAQLGRGPGSTSWLVATTRLDDFRVAVVEADLAGDAIALPAEALAALAIEEGAAVRVAPL